MAVDLLDAHIEPIVRLSADPDRRVNVVDAAGDRQADTVRVGALGQCLGFGTSGRQGENEGAGLPALRPSSLDGRRSDLSSAVEVEPDQSGGVGVVEIEQDRPPPITARLMMMPPPRSMPLEPTVHSTSIV